MRGDGGEVQEIVTWGLPLRGDSDYNVIINVHHGVRYTPYIGIGCYIACVQSDMLKTLP